MALGATLALAYLTKSFMFSMSLLILIAAFLVARQWVARGNARYVLASAIAFLIIVAPYLAGVSAHTGKLTFGESGTYNYAVHVDGVSPSHWQGDPGKGEVLLHPTREIFVQPATFEFRSANMGTYPVWYDPSYWYEGVKLRYSVRGQGKALFENVLHELETVVFGMNGVLFAGLFLACYQEAHRPGASMPTVIRGWFKYWFLLLLPLAAIGSYGLVHFEPRYLAPFFVVLVLCLFAPVPAGDGIRRPSLMPGVALLLIGMFSVQFVLDSANFAKYNPVSYYKTAEAAGKMGLEPGDRIASLDYSLMSVSIWAYLARLQIVAEVYYWPSRAEIAGNSFWDADVATQRELLQKLSQTGARAVISEEKPRGPDAARWLPMGATGSYLYWLQGARSAALRHAGF